MTGGPGWALHDPEVEVMGVARGVNEGFSSCRTFRAEQKAMGHDPGPRSALLKDGVGQHLCRPIDEVEKDDGCGSQIETKCVAILKLREVRNAGSNGVASRLLDPVWLDVDPETSGAARGSRGYCQTAVTAPKVVDDVARLDVRKRDHLFDDLGWRRNIWSEYVAGWHSDGILRGSG